MIMKKRIISALSSGFIISALSLTVTPSNVLAEGLNGDSFIDKNNFNVINEGQVKALAVRLGFSDHPVDNTNPLYIEDDYLYDIFNNTSGSDPKTGVPYDNAENFILRSSFGKQSIKLEKIIDIQLDNEQSSYYPAEEEWNGGIYADFDEIENIVDSDEFYEKLSAAVDLSDYDSNNDGFADAVYVFDMSPDNGKEDNFLGFFKGRNENNQDLRIKYTYIPSNAFTEYSNIKETVMHETGHMLWGLPDLYGRSGYINLMSSNTIGNLMGVTNGLRGDIDGYSKYLIGWIGEVNVIKYNKQDIIESAREIHLQPSDGDYVQDKLIAIIDCGDHKKIAIEYVSCSNNNKSPLPEDNLCGFRFYDLYDDEIQELFDNDEKSVFAEGDELFDLFGQDIMITDIHTGDDPRLVISYGNGDSVSKGLVNSSVINEYYFQEENNVVYSDLFNYDDEKVALIKYDNAGKGVLCLYNKGVITEQYILDLSFIDENIRTVKVKITEKGELLLLCSASRDGESYIIKTDKEGKVYSKFLKINGSIDDAVLICEKLKCSCKRGDYVIISDYCLADIENMILIEPDYENIIPFRKEVDKDSYLALDSESKNYFILDKNDNIKAVLQKENTFYNTVVTSTEYGYLSVERKEHNGTHVYELTKYDENGNVIMTDHLKESGDKLYMDNQYFNGIFYDRKLIDSGNGFLLPGPGGLIIADSDTLEAEYFGNVLDKYNEYNDFRYLSLKDGTILVSARKMTDSGSFIICEIKNVNDNGVGNDESGETRGIQIVNEVTDKPASSNKEDFQDKDNAENTAGKAGNSEKEVISENTATDTASSKGTPADDEGVKKEAVEAHKVSRSAGTVVVSAPATGDENNLPAYYTVAGISAAVIAAVFFKLKIKEKE